MMNNIEFEDVYIDSVGLNFNVPKSWSDTRKKQYGINYNKKLSPEDRISNYDKIIPYDETIDSSIKVEPEAETFSSDVANYMGITHQKDKAKKVSPIKTGTKSSWNSTLDFIYNAYLGAKGQYIDTIEDMMLYALEKTDNRDWTPRDRERIEFMKTLEKKEELKNVGNAFSSIRANINPYESEFAQNVGSLAPTGVMTGVSIAYPPASFLTIPLFALNEEVSTKKDLLDEGAPLVEAEARARTSASLNALLEMGQIKLFTKFYKKKHLPFIIGGSAVGEGGTESLQEVATMLSKGKYDKRSFNEKLDAVYEAGLYGGLGSLIFNLPAYGATSKTLEIKEKIYNGAIKAGYTPKQSLEIANKAVPEVGQLKEDITEFLNEQGVEVSLMTEKDKEKLKKDYEEAVNNGGEEALFYLDTKLGLQEIMEKAGINSEQAEENAMTYTSIAMSSYKIAKDSGEYEGTFSDYAKEYFKLNNIINYAQNEPISEAEQDDIWREVERERVEELQEGIDKYMEESQGGVLYSAAAAMFPNPRTDIDSFYEFVKSNPNHKKSYMVFKSKDGIPLDIVSDTIKHDENDHNLSIEEWRDVLDNIDNIEEARFSAKPTSYGNRAYLLKIKTPKRKYGMSVAFNKGHNYVTTLFKTTDKGYEHWVNKVNKKTAVAPAPYPQVGSSSTQRGNVSYGLSVEDIINLLKSNVNKNDIRNNSKLYQKAYAGSRVDYDRPSLEAIGSGEGAQVHGWGLYYALSKDVAENYRETFVGENQVGYAEEWAYKGKVIDSKFYDITGNSIHDQVWYDIMAGSYGVDLKKKVPEIVERYKGRLDTWQEVVKDKNLSETRRNNMLEEIEYIKELYEYAQSIEVSELKITNKGQVHEVDIPENPYLLDEQKTFNEQSEYVKERLVEVMEGLRQPNFKEKIFENKEEAYDFFDKKLEEYKRKGDGFERFHPKEFTTENGEYGVKYVDDYTVIENFLENGDILGGGIYDRIVQIVGSKKQASQLLEIYGIKGITYEGRQDGRAFVIFNPDDVKVLEKFYSQTEGDILGSYDIAKREVELFSDERGDTITHELSHHFFISHLKAMDSLGLNSVNKTIFEWIGERNNKKIKTFKDMDNNDLEVLTEVFMDYLNTNEAPNIATRSLFKRAKDWLFREYEKHRNYANDEVREYFDSLIAKDEVMPDVKNILSNLGEFKAVLSKAQNNEKTSYRGITREDVKNLQKALHTRVRRKGKSLRDELIEIGGIKEGTELAKALGFDVLKKDKMFTLKDTAIDKEDELIDWLADKGYITPVQEGESYSDTEKRWAEVEKLIYNADTTYRIEEQRINEERETALINQANAQEIVDDLLKDNKLGLKSISDLDNLLSRVLSKQDETDIIKINNNAIKYLKLQQEEANKNLKAILREIKKEKKQAKEERYQSQNAIRKYIANLPLNYKHKLELDGNIQRVYDIDSLEMVLDSMKPRITEMIETEEKHFRNNAIKEILKRAKPKDRKKQFSTYDYNTLFEELRGINALSKEQAQTQLDNSIKELSSKGEFSWQDLIKNEMLSYKANGFDASVDVFRNLHRDIEELYLEAVQKGMEAQIEKRENKEAKIKEMVDYVDTHEPAKNFISRLFNKSKKSNDIYIKNTDFYGISNALFGKKWADKNEMLTVLNEVDKKTFIRLEKIYGKGKEIYKVSRSELIDVLASKEQELENLTLKANDGLEYDLSTLDIMYLYLQMKNEKSRNKLLENYEEFDEDGVQTTNQIEGLIKNLTKEDKAFADMLQKDLEQNYKELNKVYVKLYGIDMKQEENYFPRKSERPDSSYDKRYVNPNLTVASQMKDRANNVKPIPSNVWTLYNRSIQDFYYMTEAFEKFKGIYETVNSNLVINKLEHKYDETVIDELRDTLEAMSLDGRKIHIPDMEGKCKKIVNNIIGSKIALNINVFAKQLISITNYAERVPVDEFVKNLSYALAHPKEVINFMNEFDGDFFKARFEKGAQSEAVERFLHEAESLKNSWIKPSKRYKWGKIMSSFVRFGDIAPIYFGGYARVKNLLDSGVSVKEARKQFEFETLQSQQASNAASLAGIQRSTNPFAMLFTAFMNAPAQYMRKIYNAELQYRRKEIEAEEFMKTVFNYGVIQPAIYVLLSNLLSKLWDGENEDPLYSGLATQLITSPLQGIPFVASMLTNIGNMIERDIRGERVNYNLISVLGIDDINRAARAVNKKNWDAVDVIDILTPVVEMFTVAPINQTRQIVKAIETRIN